jgi:hypothetical protein
MKFVSADSFEYTDESGESENSMKVFVSGKETRVAAVEPAKSQSAQCRAFSPYFQGNGQLELSVK